VGAEVRALEREMPQRSGITHAGRPAWVRRRRTSPPSPEPGDEITTAPIADVGTVGSS
jgi:hypothetical protein